MFIYETKDSLNVTFEGRMPVENPDVVIKGYKNGASLTVNGTEVVSVADAEEFEGKANTLVYQKDGKLMITFRGIEGMENPEVVLDEAVKGTVVATVNGTEVTLTYDDTTVSVATEQEDPVEEPDEEPVEETPVEEPTEVTEE